VTCVTRLPISWSGQLAVHEEDMTNRVLQIISLAGIAALLLMPGCKISKQGNGEDKQVSIEAPGASVKVDTGKTTNDTGLSLYPGAQEKRNTADGKQRAHVSVDTPFLNVKVVALSFTSADSPEKILNFYRNRMAGFGTVVECKGGSDDNDFGSGRKLESPVKCGKEHGEPGEITLKVGTEGNQRVVSVKPSGSGSQFSLIYVHLGNAKNEDDYSGKQPS
jgi:hypothetical protein